MVKKIFLTIDRVIERVANWGLLISGILILLMGFLSTYAVIRRYVLHDPEPYSYELSTIFLTACVVMAIAGLQRAKRHLRVDFISNLFSLKAQDIFADVICPILALIYVGVIVWQSWEGTLYSFRVHETSQSVWQEPLWPTKLIVPVSMFWLCLVLIAQLVRGIRDLFKPGRAKTKEDDLARLPPDIPPDALK